MRPPRTKDKGHGGMIAFAWFVWDRSARALPSPQIGWIKPRRE